MSKPNQQQTLQQATQPLSSGRYQIQIKATDCEGKTLKTTITVEPNMSKTRFLTQVGTTVDIMLDILDIDPDFDYLVEFFIYNGVDADYQPVFTRYLDIEDVFEAIN